MSVLTIILTCYADNEHYEGGATHAVVEIDHGRMEDMKERQGLFRIANKADEHLNSIVFDEDVPFYAMSKKELTLLLKSSVYCANSDLFVVKREVCIKSPHIRTDCGLLRIYPHGISWAALERHSGISLSTAMVSNVDLTELALKLETLQRKKNTTHVTT